MEVGNIVKSSSGIFKIIHEHEPSHGEDKPRFDIQELSTGYIIKGSYLYNGSWEIIEN